jgi:hypothetical protein
MKPNLSVNTDLVSDIVGPVQDRRDEHDGAWQEGHWPRRRLRDTHGGEVMPEPRFSHAWRALFLLVVAGSAGAEDRFPVVGGWGFDWLHPARARCREIAAKDAERFRACRYSKEFAFGLDMMAYACKADGRAEFVIFRTKNDCREAFETMQANAP